MQRLSPGDVIGRAFRDLPRTDRRVAAGRPARVRHQRRRELGVRRGPAGCSSRPWSRSCSPSSIEGMVVQLVRDVQDGRRDNTVGELFSSVSPVLLPLIAVSILAGLGIAHRVRAADRPGPDPADLLVGGGAGHGDRAAGGVQRLRPQLGARARLRMAGFRHDRARVPARHRGFDRGSADRPGARRRRPRHPELDLRRAHAARGGAHGLGSLFHAAGACAARARLRRPRFSACRIPAVRRRAGRRRGRRRPGVGRRAARGLLGRAGR